MESDLLALKNLGITSVNWLHAVGIRSRKELEHVGAVEAYNRIRERGIKVSKVLLYALHAGLRDIHWNELEDDEKYHLVQTADRHFGTIDQT
jgi:DNA transformation protein and related proteins